jgi:hypothetical protein
VKQELQKIKAIVYSGATDKEKIFEVDVCEEDLDIVSIKAPPSQNCPRCNAYN